MPHHIHLVKSFNIQQGELIPVIFHPSETYPDKSIHILKTKYERKQLITSSREAINRLNLTAQEYKENW